jgi:hypothetical protein
VFVFSENSPGRILANLSFSGPGNGLCLDTGRIGVCSSSSTLLSESELLLAKIAIGGGLAYLVSGS